MTEGGSLGGTPERNSFVYINQFPQRVERDNHTVSCRNSRLLYDMMYRIGDKLAVSFAGLPNWQRDMSVIEEVEGREGMDAEEARGEVNENVVESESGSNVVQSESGLNVVSGEQVEKLALKKLGSMNMRYFTNLSNSRGNMGKRLIEAIFQVTYLLGKSVNGTKQGDTIKFAIDTQVLMVVRQAVMKEPGMGG
jgi:hypothetical protein